MITGEMKAAAYQGSGQSSNIQTNLNIQESQTVVNVQGKTSQPQTLQENKQKSEKIVSTDQVKQAVQEFNKNSKNTTAIYGIHEDTNRITIKIVDKGTREVLKEFPPEDTLDMLAKVWELAGLTVDEKR